MAARKPESVARIFTGLVPDEIAAAYARLLAADGVAEEEASDFVGGGDVKRVLCDLGMAHTFGATPTSPATFAPAAPELAMQGVLADLQARVLQEQRLLLDGMRRAIQAEAWHPVSDEVPAHLVDIVTDRDEITRITTSLINSARREWMTLESLNRDIQLAEEQIIDPPRAVRGRLTMRAIYDQPFTQDPVGRRIIKACADNGEQARVRSRIRMKMQLADTTAVMMPLTLTGMGGAMLIHAEPVVAAMREYFELLWERAAPISGSPQNGACPLTPAQQKVLNLLAQGYQDSQIAKQTGISESSVHRHATAILKRLDASTRFEAGVTAHRWKWIS